MAARRRWQRPAASFKCCRPVLMVISVLGFVFVLCSGCAHTTHSGHSPTFRCLCTFDLAETAGKTSSAHISNSAIVDLDQMMRGWRRNAANGNSWTHMCVSQCASPTLKTHTHTHILTIFSTWNIYRLSQISVLQMISKVSVGLI